MTTATIMTTANVAAVLLFVGVIAYAVFAGADFGSGVWDLFAGSAEKGGLVRAQIDHSIGPVWEANHVWLIYVIVFLWSAFPRASAAIFTTLFIPWIFVGLGIVLRGGGFAFRKFSNTLDRARIFGAVFAVSSIITPFFLGMIAGGIANGRVPLSGGDAWTSWTGPTSWVGGVLAVLTCAFSAAVFLAADAQRSGHTEMAKHFGRSAILCGAITGIVALVAIIPIRLDSKILAGRLQGRAAPLVVISALAGLAAMWDLRSGRYIRARLSAVVAVGSIVTGWGVAQYPDVLIGHATIAEVAGARPTLIGLIIVFAIAAVTAVPALLWLYVLVDREKTAPIHQTATSADRVD